MRDPKQPVKEANNVIALLDAVLGEDRYPLNIEEICLEYSRNKFPDHRIKEVKGDDDLSGFEGALYGSYRDEQSRWLILYNKEIPQLGRINFTLAHEFGHYLLHRHELEKFECSQEDLSNFHDDAQRESEANKCASQLLMPPNDFRKQIDRQKIDFNLIEHCTDRYSVSLTAMLLKLVEITDKRCVLVLSRSGFILWSKPSQSALETGKFIKTVGLPPVPIPQASVANTGISNNDNKIEINHGPGIWWPDEPVKEMTVFSRNFDLVITLLKLPDDPPGKSYRDFEDPDSFDSFDNFEAFNGGVRLRLPQN